MPESQIFSFLIPTLFIDLLDMLEKVVSRFLMVHQYPEWIFVQSWSPARCVPLNYRLSLSITEKLRWLLFRTGFIQSELECANFLSGLLPCEEQLKIWKNILGVVYHHQKKDRDVPATTKSQECQPDPVSPVTNRAKVK